MYATLRQLAARLRAWLRPTSFDQDLNDELQTHASLLAEEHVKAGLSPEEALRRARVELGGLTQIREAHRDVRGIPLFDSVLQDIRHSFRSLRRDPGFTTFAILIVGLGIGASSTIFSTVNALLIKPLPFHDSSRLVWIANDGEQGNLSSQTVPVNPFLDLRSQSKSLSEVAAYYAFYEIGDKMMTGEGEPERFTAVPVSQNLFKVLGVQPIMGRSFTEEECRRYLPVVVLSSAMWKRRFASDPNILGRKLTFTNRVYQVIGVMPPGFDFSSVFAPANRVDFFLPFPLTNDTNKMGNTLSMVGRLKPAFTIQQAQAELSTLSEPIRLKNNRDELRFKATLLEDQVRGPFRQALLVLVLAVGVVMLIVCANLSNLQLSRAASRQKEMAVRVALGAGRGRLIRQLLTESLVLSCCSAVLGLIVAIAGTQALSRLEALVLPLRDTVQFEASSFAFTFLIAVAAGLIFGALPALRIPSATGATRGSTEGKSHGWIRSALVISEIAFACILLVGAGLLIRSFLNVLDVDMGFRPQSVTTLRIDRGRGNYYDEVLRLTKTIPGVQSVGLTDVLPLGHNRSWNAGAKGVTYTRSTPPPEVFVRIVSEGYLKSMGIPLRSGRDLSDHDTATSKPVILINETLARKLWPGRDPIGQTAIHVDKDREVVGVVSDVRHLTPEQGSGNEMYIPIRQTNDFPSVELVIRANLPPAALATAVRRELKPLIPNLPAEFRTLQQLVDNSTSPRRFLVQLLTGFSAFALLLASLGIYSVVSYSVSQRSHEIGIRMALGATAANVQRSIVSKTLGLAGMGIAIGLIGSWALSKILSGMLFGVTAADPITFLSTLLLLALVATVASYIPARRASLTSSLQVGSVSPANW